MLIISWLYGPLSAMSIAFDSELKPALLKGAPPRLSGSPKLIPHKSEVVRLDGGRGGVGLGEGGGQREF